MADEFKFEVRGLSEGETPIPSASLPPIATESNAEGSAESEYQFEVRDKNVQKSPPPPPPPSPRGMIFESPAGEAGAGLGAGIGYALARKPAKINALVEKEMLRQQIAEMAKAQEPPQMRPSAQPAGTTAARIMERGPTTAGDRWAIHIGGPGGRDVSHAAANQQMQKTLQPGEVLMRSGLAVVPDVRTNLGQIEAEALRRENPPPRPPSMGSQAMGALGAASQFLGPNRIIGPLAGALAGYHAGKGAEQLGRDEYINALLSGLSATGGAMMASGVPAFQIPGAALTAAPYAGRAMAPAGADLLERLFPLNTGMERQPTQQRQPTREELVEAMSRQMLRGRVQ